MEDDVQRSVCLELFTSARGLGIHLTSQHGETPRHQPLTCHIRDKFLLKNCTSWNSTELMQVKSRLPVKNVREGSRQFSSINLHKLKWGTCGSKSGNLYACWYGMTCRSV